MRRTSIAAMLCTLALLIITTGCAINRGILDVRIAPGPDPANAKVVRIVRVSDQRVFESRPQMASIPSLMGGQIDNEQVKSRAIARKRNAWGKALGDILLPEGRTVENLVEEALRKALHDKGYAVISGSAGGEGIPLEADITQLWAWMTPGTWSISLDFEAIVEIKSPVIRNGQETAKGSTTLHSVAASTSAWMNTITQGMDELIAGIKEKLVSP